MFPGKHYYYCHYFFQFYSGFTPTCITIFVQNTTRPLRDESSFLLSHVSIRTDFYVTGSISSTITMEGIAGNHVTLPVADVTVNLSSLPVTIHLQFRVSNSHSSDYFFEPCNISHSYLVFLL
jgi:hypothetical protein